MIVVNDLVDTMDLVVKRSNNWSYNVKGVEFQDHGRPFVLEIFAGTANFTKALRDLGLDAWGIDHSSARLQPLTPAILDLDLTLPPAHAHLRRLLDHPRLCYVHFAPPCGTCSRAREIPLGGSCPPPLRTEQFPEGRPDLAHALPHQVQRVEAANILYKLVASLAQELTSKEIFWSIENPWRSLLWWLPDVAALNSLEIDDVVFSNCMFGSRRDKKTRWRHFPAGVFDCLNVRCDGMHSHDPWGRTATGYATELETAYPDELCCAAANALVKFLDFKPQQPLRVVVGRAVASQAVAAPAARVAAGVQPRGNRAPRLLPEFRDILKVCCSFRPNDPRTRPGHKWEKAEIAGTVVPEGCITQRVFWKGVTGRVVDIEGDSTPPSRGCVRDVKHFKEYDVYIGRGAHQRTGRLLARSVWANPFRVADCVDVHDSLRKFRAHLLSSPTLMSQLKSLSGRRLLCHCRDGQACHADVIIGEFREHFADQAAEATVMVGVPYEPVEFTLAALKCEHPFEQHAVSAFLSSCLQAKFRTSAQDTINFRKAAIAHWRGRVSALRDRELVLKNAMDPEVRKVVVEKQILVFGEMLAAVDFPERHVLVKFLHSGFPIVGEYPLTGTLPPRRRDATRSLEDLWRSARARQRHLQISVRPIRRPCA